MSEKKAVVITGASSGFGNLAARALARAGHIVYAGMRATTGRNAPRVDELAELSRAEGIDVRGIEMDVQDQASVDAAVERIVADQGRLDLVVHNAGHMVLGPAEAFTPEQLAQVYDVNVLSTQRVNRAALPVLRKQGSGLLVWVGSSSTRGGHPPFLAPYFAAKAAMDALAESYAAELIKFDTVIVVPGAYTSGTNHFAHSGTPADTERAAVYDERYGVLRDSMAEALADIFPQGRTADEVADEIVRVVELPCGKRPLRGPEQGPQRGRVRRGRPRSTTASASRSSSPTERPSLGRWPRDTGSPGITVRSRCDGVRGSGSSVTRCVCVPVGLPVPGRVRTRNRSGRRTRPCASGDVGWTTSKKRDVMSKQPFAPAPVPEFRPRAGRTMTHDAGLASTRRSMSARLALLEAQGDDLSVHAAMTLALEQATAAVGALGGLIHLVSETFDGLYLVAAGGLPNKVTDEWTQISTDQDTVPVRAMREGVLSWGAGDSARIDSHSTLAVPLPGTDGPLGVLTLLLWADRQPDASRCSFLTSVARWAAQWLGQRTAGPASGRGGTDGARATDRRRTGPADAPRTSSAAGARGSAARRTSRMTELTSALADAVTAQDVVEVVADRVLPPFGADGVVIEAIESGRLHVVGAVGYAQEFLDRRLEGLPGANVLMADVLGRCRPVFVESTADFIRCYPELRGLAHPDKNSWAFLPLIASGRDIGCCVISFALPHTFTEEERTLLTALSGLVAQALERARLYDDEHCRAQSLQQGLLPKALPLLPAATSAACYLPASEGAAVGGDWYDVIPLSADRVAMVVGDVMGHGIAEAVTMGRLRTAVRTLTDLELPPDEMFAHLNELVKELDDDSYVTCLYAVFDPVSGICTFCLAGHPPPVLVHPDGTLHLPRLVANPPLGAAEPPFDTQELRLPQECVLVCYTDGLLRSAGRDIDEGVALLVRALADAVSETAYFAWGRHENGSGCLGHLCDIITSTLTHDRPRAVDDAALLLTHTRMTADEDVASWTLADGPTAAAEARKHVRRQLAVWGLDELEPSTEVVVSELVGNAIRHASGPIRVRLLRSRSLVCEVYDGSLTTPRIRRAGQLDECGRGLYLVSALSRRWGARYRNDGKCIWAEQALAPEPAQRL